LGDGTYNDHSSPIQVHNLDHVVYLAARDYHMLVIKDDGTVWTWGSGTFGELGNNTFANSTLPVQAQFPDASVILDKLLFLPLTLR
jgi:alpha-tubulin suppressor-like RCC1 family protein